MKDALEKVADFIALDVLNAMTASVVIFTADGFFRSDQRAFRFNPANTLPYQAMRALEDRAIVDLSEVVHNKSILPEDVSLRRMTELLFHRLSLSHTATVKWTKPGMQEFVDAGSHVRDVRAALVWDLQRSLNEELRKVGGRCWNETVEVSEPMAAMLELILKLSATDPANVPERPELLGVLRTFRDEFVAIIVENPDGKLPNAAPGVSS